MASLRTYRHPLSAKSERLPINGSGLDKFRPNPVAVAFERQCGMLEQAERDALDALNLHHVSIDREEVVHCVGDPADRIYLVTCGWLASCRYGRNGCRHVLQFHHVHDVTTTIQHSAARFDTELRALESSELCVVSQPAFAELLLRYPRLAYAVLQWTRRDLSVLQDTLYAATRFDAKHRVLWLLLFLFHRLQPGARRLDAAFRPPMNQSYMGDLLGLTNVSVSKAIGELERDGAIVRSSHGTIVLNDIDRLIETTGFRDRYTGAETADSTENERGLVIFGSDPVARRAVLAQSRRSVS